MAKLRDYAACIGLSGNFSVRRNFFGYNTQDVQSRSIDGVRTLSLQKQMSVLRGKHIHLNLIRTNTTAAGIMAHGSSNPNFNVEALADRALHRARLALEQPSVNMGIGRVEHHFIQSSDWDYGSVLNTCVGEDSDLYCKHSVDNNGLDAYFITEVFGDDEFDTSGRSPICGSCDKDSKRSGLIAEVRSDRTLAHEIGHFLGLEHPDETDVIGESEFNLMQVGSKSLTLTPKQAAIIRKHCIVQPGCIVPDTD